MIHSVSISFSSYASDDYFGLLDDEEGHSVNDIVDIGIGCQPVRPELRCDHPRRCGRAIHRSYNRDVVARADRARAMLDSR